MPATYYPHLEKTTRTLGHGEVGLYLDRILPGIYAELYMLPVDQKHQVMTALRQELVYWGGLDNHSIETRMVARG